MIQLSDEDLRTITVSLVNWATLVAAVYFGIRYTLLRKAENSRTAITLHAVRKHLDAADASLREATSRLGVELDDAGSLATTPTQPMAASVVSPRDDELRRLMALLEDVGVSLAAAQKQVGALPARHRTTDPDSRQSEASKQVTAAVKEIENGLAQAITRTETVHRLLTEAIKANTGTASTIDELAPPSA